MNEMLIVYLYGIYPEGGLSALLGSFSVLTLFAAWVMDGPMMEPEDSRKFLKKMKPLYIATIIVMTIGYFIPSKNIFLTMIATPHIIESLESKTGKLNKLDRLLDKALDEALKENK